MAVQIVIIAIPGLICARIRTDYRSRFFHPLNWLVFFYCIWFGIPQIYFLVSGGYVVGLDQYDLMMRFRFCITAQCYLIVFLLCVILSSWTVQAAFSKGVAGTRPIRFERGGYKVYRVYAISCLLVGIAATIALGKQNMEIDGMRSELVKTTSGKILTSLMYFGMYGFGYLLAESIFKKRWLTCVLLVVAFGGPTFLTGARARFLFPFVDSVIFVATRRRKLFSPALLVAALVSLSVVMFADALFKSIKQDAEAEIEGQWTEMFERRNFDGFSNFTLICNTYNIQHRQRVLVTGARNTFMNHYFPEYYARGVGFGTTLPGVAWIAMGAGGLLLVGAVYGAGLGLLDVWLRTIDSPQLYWSYLLAITWICAIGGNFIESADKMIIALSPALIAYVLGRVRLGPLRLSPAGPTDHNDPAD